MPKQLVIYTLAFGALIVILSCGLSDVEFVLFVLSLSLHRYINSGLNFLSPPPAVTLAHSTGYTGTTQKTTVRDLAQSQCGQWFFKEMESELK